MYWGHRKIRINNLLDNRFDIRFLENAPKQRLSAKTAFTLPGLGQFEWLISPMGLVGCPVCFKDSSLPRSTTLPQLRSFLLNFASWLLKKLKYGWNLNRRPSSHCEIALSIRPPELLRSLLRCEIRA